jgi:phage terminase large subunit
MGRRLAALAVSRFGSFPEQAVDSLISLKWLEAARRPKVLPNDEAQLYAGIDVAEAGGDDETVCAVRTRSGRIVAMQSWHGNSRGPVIAFLRTFKDRLVEINFDRAGVGAYFATDFESFGFININGINVGEATDFPDRYRNLKAQLYWSLRERFQNGEVSGLDDEVSVTQLASVRYEINPRGQSRSSPKKKPASAASGLLIARRR